MGGRADLLRARAGPARAGRGDGAQPVPRARRRVARRSGRHAYALFSEGAAALATCRKDSHHDLLSMAEELAAASPVGRDGVPEVVAGSAEAHPRLGAGAAGTRPGTRSSQQSVEGGEAYFRLESGKGEEVLQQLSSRVDLSRVGEVLRLYCKALTGTNISDPAGLRPRGEGHRLGERERPDHRGHGRLPAGVHRGVRRARPELLRLQGLRHPPDRAPRVRQLLLPLRARRRACWRRRATSASASASPRARSRCRAAASSPTWSASSTCSTTASWRPTSSPIAEDMRIDTLVRREYGGIRRAWQRTQENEVRDAARCRASCPCARRSSRT